MRPTSLNELMDHLAEKNWPASDRAIVYTEWRNLVRAALVSPPPNDEDRFYEGIAARAKEQLLGLDDPSEFRKNGLDYTSIFGYENNLDSKKKMVETLRGYPSSAQQEQNGWCSWASYVSSGSSYSPDFHREIREMEMDDEDLLHMMQADRMGLKELPSAKRSVSLEAAQKYLSEAFRKSGFHRLEIPALDAEDPGRLQDLADCISALNKNFKVIGGDSFTFGRKDATLFIGVDRAGSSGYCTGAKFIACAPKTGFPMIEVLAHESLHMHDYAMGKNGKLGSEDAGIENPRGKVAAWSRLLRRLHEAPPETKSSNEKRWKQAVLGLGDRWESMGIPKDRLNQMHEEWLSGKLSKKAFQKDLAQLFREAGKGDTSEFRANVVVVECELMRRARKERPVWEQFAYEFGDMLSAKEMGVYSAHYFAEPCEILARSFQMLFSQKEDASKSNPFAARWLVFPGQDQLPHIKEAWKDFFETPCVKSCFPAKAPTKGAILPQGGFASALAARRSESGKVPAPKQKSSLAPQ